MTLKEIAEQAGTSISTVSRIINNKNYNCSDTKLKETVWKIIQDSGYVPNEMAKNLRSGNLEKAVTKKGIGLLFSTKAHTFNDHNFSVVAEAVQREIIHHGYKISFMYTCYSDEHIDDCKEYLEQNKCDGLVVFGRLSSELVPFLKNCTKNIVTIGFTKFNASHDFVFFDGYKAAQEMLSFMHNNGHRKIAYIGAISSEARYESYCDFMNEKSIELNPLMIKNSQMCIQNGYEACNEMLSSGIVPTAIFCSNDLIAIGVYKSIRQHDLLIPQNISVCSIDDIEPSQFVYPMLTTVTIPKEEMAYLAVNTLIAKIKKELIIPIRIEVPRRIIIRGSCDNI